MATPKLELKEIGIVLLLCSALQAGIIICPEQMPEMCLINSDKNLENSIRANISKLRWKKTRGMEGHRLPSLSLFFSRKGRVVDSYLIDKSQTFSLVRNQLAGPIFSIDFSRNDWVPISFLPLRDTRNDFKDGVVDIVTINVPLGMNITGISSCGLDSDSFVVQRNLINHSAFNPVELIEKRWGKSYQLFPESWRESVNSFYYLPNFGNHFPDSTSHSDFLKAHSIDSLFFHSFNMISAGSFGDDGEYIEDGSDYFRCPSFSSIDYHRGLFFRDSTPVAVVGNWGEIESSGPYIAEFKYARFRTPLKSHKVDASLEMPKLICVDKSCRSIFN